MTLVKKSNRNALQMISWQALLPPDSFVPIIDAFVDSCDPKQLGFIIKGNSVEGRPAYHAAILIRLFIFGYLNGIRSSRKLDLEAKRNIELFWLLSEQKPSYKTIANFRKDNSTAFKLLFDHFRDFCISLNLYGKKTIAIDGTKFRAQNSKKNNYNKKKILQHIEYIDNQTNDYLSELDKNDIDEQKLASLNNRKEKYKQLQKQLEKSDQLQISTTDPDARALPLKMNIIQVAYNLQSAVDDKHNLITDFELTNYQDADSLASLAISSKNALGLKQEDYLTVLADKGYYKGQQILECHDNNIDTLVAIRAKPNTNKAAHVRKDKFIYDKENNQYICPKGSSLKQQGDFYSRKLNGKVQFRFKRYIAQYEECIKCPFVDDCVTQSNQKLKRGRLIDRSEYESARQINDDNIKSRMAEYKRRQAIVEHPFGTIKRQWGFTHTIMKGMKNVATECSIILLCYNLKRVANIVGANELKEALKSLFCSILMFFTTASLIRYYNNTITHRISYVI